MSILRRLLRELLERCSDKELVLEAGRPLLKEEIVSYDKQTETFRFYPVRAVFFEERMRQYRSQPQM